MPPLWIWLRVLEKKYSGNADKPITVLDLIKILKLVKEEQVKIMNG